MDLNINHAISQLSSFISHESPATRNSLQIYRDTIKDEEKFLNRVHSFTSTEWYGRPLWLSPVICASRGWAYIGGGILQCQSCDNKIGGNMDPNLDIHAASLTYKRLENLLVNGHSAWCIWKSCSVPDKFLRINIQEEVQHNFIRRFKSLFNINTIPLISKEFILDIDEERCKQILKDFLVLKSNDYCHKKMLLLISLALCGWFVSETNREILVCKFCKRSLGLWNYKTTSELNGNNCINRAEINTDINLINQIISEVQANNIPQVDSNIRNSEDVDLTEVEVSCRQSLEDESLKDCINNSLNKFNTADNINSFNSEICEDIFINEKLNNLNAPTNDVYDKHVCRTLLLEEDAHNTIGDKNNKNVNDIGRGDKKIENEVVEEIHDGNMINLNVRVCDINAVGCEDTSTKNMHVVDEDANGDNSLMGDCNASEDVHNDDELATLLKGDYNASNGDNSLFKASDAASGVIDHLEVVPLNVAANKLKRHLDCLHDALQLEFKKRKLVGIDKMALHPVTEHEPWCIWVGQTKQLYNNQQFNKLNNGNYSDDAPTFINSNLSIDRLDKYESNELVLTDDPYLQVAKLIFYPVDLSALNHEKRIIEVHRVKNLLNL